MKVCPIKGASVCLFFPMEQALNHLYWNYIEYALSFIIKSRTFSVVVWGRATFSLVNDQIIICTFKENLIIYSTKLNNNKCLWEIYNEFQTELYSVFHPFCFSLFRKRRSRILGSLWSCLVPRWEKLWCDSPRRPVGTLHQSLHRTQWLKLLSCASQFYHQVLKCSLMSN